MLLLIRQIGMSSLEMVKAFNHHEDVIRIGLRLKVLYTFPNQLGLVYQVGFQIS